MKKSVCACVCVCVCVCGTSPVAQRVKSPPAMQETQETHPLPSLGLEDPLEEEIGNPVQHSCLKKSRGQRSLVGYSPKGCRESDMTERLSMHTNAYIYIYN